MNKNDDMIYFVENDGEFESEQEFEIYGIDMAMVGRNEFTDKLSELISEEDDCGCLDDYFESTEPVDICPQLWCGKNFFACHSKDWEIVKKSLDIKGDIRL